jgi:hypothetical protein
LCEGARDRENQALVLGVQRQGKVKIFVALKRRRIKILCRARRGKSILYVGRRNKRGEEIKICVGRANWGRSQALVLGARLGKIKL